MQNYVKEILENNSVMPDPSPDILRFSELHSWYKHLPNFVKAYPLLIKGEERRNDQDSCFGDANQNNYHWRFIFEDDLGSWVVSYKIKDITVDETKEYDDEELYDITYINPEIIKIIKKHPIYFSNRLSPSECDPLAIFQRLVATKMCEEVWEEIINYNKKEELEIEEMYQFMLRGHY